MTATTSTFETFKPGTMVICSEGIGKVLAVEHYPNDYGGMDPLHSIQLNGEGHIYRTVNDLQPTNCTEYHRYDPHMKWCADCMAEEVGKPTELSV